MEPEISTYEVFYDPAVMRRIVKAGIRFFWKHWFSWWLIVGGFLLIHSAILCLTISYLDNVDAFSRSSGPSLLVSCSVAVLCMLYYAHRMVKSADSIPSDEVWQCEISPEGWSYRNKAGVLRFIPWKLMVLKFEHPEGWLIKFEQEHVWVYRRPLRDAGLEEVFRSRIFPSSR